MFFSEFTHTVLSRKRCDLDTFFLGEEEEGEKNHLFAELNASFLLRFFPFPLPGNRDIRHIFFKKRRRRGISSFFGSLVGSFLPARGNFIYLANPLALAFAAGGGLPVQSLIYGVGTPPSLRRKEEGRGDYGWFGG